MVLAWVGFATLAIIAARYMKDAWGKLFGLKKWFQVNKRLHLLRQAFAHWNVHCDSLIKVGISFRICQQEVFFKNYGLTSPCKNIALRSLYCYGFRLGVRLLSEGILLRRR